MATILRPATYSAPTSPVRPVSSYSIASTIRKVTPSPPNSLPPSLFCDADSADFRSFSPTPSSALRSTRHSDFNFEATMDQPPPPSPTPAEQQQRRRHVRGNGSPPHPGTKLLVPELPPFQFPNASVDDGVAETERPETPSPVSDEQRKEQYTPLGASTKAKSETEDPDMIEVIGHRESRYMSQGADPYGWEAQLGWKQNQGQESGPDNGTADANVPRVEITGGPSAGGVRFQEPAVTKKKGGEKEKESGCCGCVVL